MRASLQDSMREQGIRFLILFGSHAKGKANDHSDVDVGFVSVQPLAFTEISELKEAVAEAMHFSEDAIDLVNLEKAAPLLQFQAAESGKLIAGNEADFRVFRVLAWRRYIDTAKLRVLRGKKLKKAYAE